MRKGVGMTVLVTMLSVVPLPTGVAKADEDEKKAEVERHIKNLIHKNPALREWAEIKLVLKGHVEVEKDATVEALTKALQNEDPSMKIAVARVLSLLGKNAGKAVPKLGDLLIEDRSSEVRRNVVYALQKVGQPAEVVIPQLLKALQDEDRVVRRFSVNTLRGLSIKGSDRREVVRKLGQLLLTDSDVGVRISIVDALWQFKAITPLKEALKKERDLSVRNMADNVIAVLEYKKSRLSPLEQVLRDLKDKEDLALRRDAAAALREFRDKKALGQYVPALIGALKDPDPVVRTDIAYVLGKLVGDAKDSFQPSIVKQLVEALKDSEPSVRRGVAFALWELGEYAKDSLRPSVSQPFGSPLADALKDKDPEVRRYIAFALAKLGGDAREAIVPLVDTLKDKKVEVRRGAAFALRKIGAEAKESIRHFIPQLMDAAILNKDDESLREDLLAILIPRLVENLAASQESVRNDALHDLRELRRYFMAEIDPELRALLKKELESCVAGHIGYPSFEAEFLAEDLAFIVTKK